MPLNKKLKKVLVIGSGPIVIGQAAEFDYAGTQACIALKEEGIEVVLINNNPATIMTDEAIADKVYIEPLNVETIEKIIQKEKPDGVIGTLGGQTGLNLTVQLYEQGILEKYNVKLLGTSVESIKNGEDRERFRNLMLEIGEPIPESAIIHSFAEGEAFVKEIGFPVIIRPAYTLGGEGGGFAYNDEELEIVLKKGLAASPIQQVLVEKSIKGWKEIEYEVMRDANDTCIIVCNMENMDPVGVHTGDSIVVAPSQTLTDVQYQMLRDVSIKVIRELKIIGGCNIQFALHPESNQYYIIEVNPRVSRSSALASKATGYPIARMAAKCAVGYHLDEIVNPITGNTFASFEPAIDYIVVKLPRFPFDKFPEADRTLGTQMKATGEVMAIDRTFEGALNKAIRSMEMNVYGLCRDTNHSLSEEVLFELLEIANDQRLFVIAEAFRRGISLEKVHQLTEIDPWFLHKISSIVALETELASYEWSNVPTALLKEAKRNNVADKLLSQIFNIPEKQVRKQWKEFDWKPGYKMVDTCSAEFDAVTPYYYSTWHGVDEVEPTNKKKILVIGSGPIRIGQGIEFDYCSVHAAMAIKKKGYEAVVINNNPETVSTDYSIADSLYFEPLAAEDVLHVIEKEQVEGVLIQFGGQTAINLAHALEEEGVKILGTTVENINLLEDRKEFYQLLEDLSIPHIEGKTVSHPEELVEAAAKLGYPVLVRPSYVIGGQAMFTIFSEEELGQYISQLKNNSYDAMWPLLVDKFLPGLECEIDVICDGDQIVVPGIFEHIEKAGVHSGDSISVFPPISMSEVVKETIIQYAEKIAISAPVIGMMNIQYVVYENQVFVLEVNPRSSRTVPIISKVTGIPMIDWAVSAQLGEKLSDLSEVQGLLPEPGYYSVKAPIFSSSKLKGVDHVLGPEMKSTGEALGMGVTFQAALEKALPALGGKAEEKYLFCSISDREKTASLPIIRDLINQDYQIAATEGTALFLRNNGISVEQVATDDQDVSELFRKQPIKAVINIPNQGRQKQKFGFQIREHAVRYKIPVFTHLDTIAATSGLQNQSKSENEVLTVCEYYDLEKRGAEHVRSI
ncbi:carbamoyl-phosphate synthase (glutamine-hydrolyzing) large subunit [Neobacillus sp. MM2021_6]|uniref:carbamoyl-phosphate synthase (glutamine-hydrolyzing) large subunit n=1 Tax=Bacillaceae TaxID=186817 RepID=UPI001408285E|nr:MULTISPECIES: carbamoyl-phosphate synthase (glutamine-hydrolyzing) large subunit [Bacillaceae]MBO0961921.1 carbamoyl-phosphate synthase (glutamine-hydrolyzing) large subunit [Neobacillus sp. MM2021_6]NHC20396.1 carbamoyl-phosphate synthase (glutamine-hydrolyzing) large subunit [Bacillus sp. MM2020_4]